MKTRILIGSLGVILGIAALPGKAETVMVPADTKISVELTENLHSAFDTEGETIYLRVAEEFTVDGKTVIPKGALVEAVVDDAERIGHGGRSGRIYFHPVRIAAADGQWLPLDPTNFSEVGERAKPGQIIANSFLLGALGAGLTPGGPAFIPRGTIYHVITRRDREVELGVLRPPREVAVADVMFSGRVKPLTKINKVHVERTKPGHDIELELDCAPEMESLVPTEATGIKIVSFVDYVPEKPVQSKSVKINSRKHLLRASFDWWSIIKYSQPGSTALIVQFELSDGRLAQADVSMQSKWKTP